MKIKLLTLLLALLFSCSRPHIQQLLFLVEKMIEEQPENALILLETVEDPAQLTPKEYAEYQLTYIKAKDKCYIDLASDTAIIKNVIDIYNRYSENMSTGWIYYYAGRVYQDANKDEAASRYYLEASDYAEKYANYKLGTMANYYLAEYHANQLAYEKAINSYKQALICNSQTKEQTYKSILLSSIGYLYGQNNQMDSALSYLKEAYAVALEQEDSLQIVNTSNDLSVFLLENKQYEEAKTYILKSINIYPDSLCISQYIILADIFLEIDEADSAEILLRRIDKKISSSRDVGSKAIYYETLSKIEESREEYSKSLNSYKLYANYQDSIYHDKEKKSLAEIEQKYNFTQTNEHNHQLRNEKKITTLTIIILCFISLFIYLKLLQKVKNKKNELYEAEEKLNILQFMLDNNNNANHIDSENISNLNEEEKETMLKSFLLQQLDISTKIALLNAQNSDKHKPFLTKFNEIMYGEQRAFKLNWEELYPLFNMLYKNFVHTLHTEFTVLTEKDIQLCCLLLINLTTSEITLLMEQSINTVHKRKTEIRKKLNMTAGADIASFFKENILIPSSK